MPDEEVIEETTEVTEEITIAEPSTSTAETALINALGSPREYENDGERVNNYSLNDLIAANKYLSRKKKRNPFGCIYVAKMGIEGGR